MRNLAMQILIPSLSARNLVTLISFICLIHDIGSLIQWPLHFRVKSARGLPGAARLVPEAARLPEVARLRWQLT